MVTEGKTPIKLSAELSHDAMVMSARISTNHLNNMVMENTNIILLINLIKRMLEEDPQKRDTCVQLIEHAVFLSIKERWDLLGSFQKNHKIALRQKDSFLSNLLNENQLYLIGSKKTEVEVIQEIEMDLPLNKNQYELCTYLLKFTQYVY